MNDEYTRFDSGAELTEGILSSIPRPAPTKKMLVICSDTSHCLWSQRSLMGAIDDASVLFSTGRLSVSGNGYMIQFTVPDCLGRLAGTKYDEAFVGHGVELTDIQRKVLYTLTKV